MSNELAYYTYAGSALVFALVSFAAVWWRQSKNQVPLGAGKMSLVFLATVAAGVVSFILLMVVAENSGYEGLESFTQPLGLASAVIAYFIGNQVAIRLCKQATK